jgi:hypothetical protein
MTSAEIKNLQPIGVTTEMAKSMCRATASGKTAMPTLLTIGHSTRPWKIFLALLRAHRVERVIDVRSTPRSHFQVAFLYLPFKLPEATGIIPNFRDNRVSGVTPGSPAYAR